MDQLQLTQIRSHPRVDYVEENQIARAVDCSLQNSAIWGLSRISERAIELDGTYKYPSHAGSGVDAYIFDTGIRVTHNEFEGRAFFDWKASSSYSDTDGNGHGTHVASTVGGKTYGVAKAVQLYAYKVLGDTGSGTYAGIVAGVDAAVAKYKSRGRRPSVGNMSLGGGYSAAVNSAVSKASSEGLIVVVAAGNDDNDACLYSPASAATVITVAASDTADQSGNQVDVRSSFSNYGDCVTMLAPGSDITGAWYNSNTATRTISGTSMASPHICGGAALYLGENPNANFPTVQAALEGQSTLGAVNMACAGDATCNKTPNKLLYVASC
jgi:subtilisin family serine protease